MIKKGFIPKSVKIFDRTFPIKFIKKVEDVNTDKDRALKGQIALQSGEIRVADTTLGPTREKRTQEDKLRTVVHEIFHAALYSMEKFKNEKETMTEEEFVELTSFILCTLAADNNWINIGR
jgi:hypothetical protein